MKFNTKNQGGCLQRAVRPEHLDRSRSLETAEDRSSPLQTALNTTRALLETATPLRPHPLGYTPQATRLRPHLTPAVHLRYLSLTSPDHSRPLEIARDLWGPLLERVVSAQHDLR